MNIYLFQMTRYHTCGTHYWDKVFSLNTCAADLLYLTTLPGGVRTEIAKHVGHKILKNGSFASKPLPSACQIVESFSTTKHCEVVIICYTHRINRTNR